MVSLYGNQSGSCEKGKPNTSCTSGNEWAKGHPLLEIKSGYFFFSEHIMRQVYNSGGIDVQLSYSQPIWKWLQIYSAVDYIQANGRSLNGHYFTKIRVIPLSLGLKPVIPLTSWLDYYLYLGPRYFFVNINNSSNYVDHSKNGNGLGGFAGTGFLFRPIEHFVIDLFGDYSYKKKSFHSSKKNVSGHSVDIGGFAFGAGLGYEF